VILPSSTALVVHDGQEHLPREAPPLARDPRLEGQPINLPWLHSVFGAGAPVDSSELCLDEALGRNDVNGEGGHPSGHEADGEGHDATQASGAQRPVPGAYPRRPVPPPPPTHSLEVVIPTILHDPPCIYTPFHILHRETAAIWIVSEHTGVRDTCDREYQRGYLQDHPSRGLVLDRDFFPED
jgi:hypothetical protein